MSEQRQQELAPKRVGDGLDGSGKADAATQAAKRARLGSSELAGSGVPASPDRRGAASPPQLVPQSGTAPPAQAGPVTAGGSRDAGVAVRSGSGGATAPPARIESSGDAGDAPAPPASAAAGMVHAASLESLIPSSGPANAQIDAGAAAREQHRHFRHPPHRHQPTQPPRPQPAASPAAPVAGGTADAHAQQAQQAQHAQQTQQAQRDHDAGGQPSSRLGTLKRERSPSPSNGEGAPRVRPLGCTCPCWREGGGVGC